VVFTHIKFFIVFFVILSSECGIVLFVVLLRCSFGFYWTSVNYRFDKWFGRRRCGSRSMGISVT